MIKEFQGVYRFLSNFWPCKVKFEGMTYPSVEHAYQAAKSLDMVVRRAIAQNPNPGAAKKLGRRIMIRPDWKIIKLSVMKRLVKYKFKHNPQLKARLLSTGDRILQEGNYWGDTFWGVCNGVGENHLGRILMEVRKELNENV